MSARFEMRWVYQQVKYRGTQLEAGQRPALCVRGRKHALCVAVGHPVRVLKRPVDAYDHYRPVLVTPPIAGGKPTPTKESPAGEAPYPVEQAVEQFRAIAAKNGATTGALRLLERASAWAKSPQSETTIDEDEYHDEEEMLKMENATPAPAATPDATTSKEKPVKSKSKPAKAKKPAAKKSAAKPAPKKSATPKKSAGKKPGPRTGTITELVVNLTKAGKDTKAIGAAVLKTFPNTTFAKEVKAGNCNAVGWYQGQARKRGWLPKAG